MIYSTSSVLRSHEGQSPFHYLAFQTLWIVMGLAVAYIASKVPLPLISRSSVVVMVISIVLLVAVLIVGQEINGAKRWINLGGFDFQPSEVAKLGFIIYLAAWLSRARPTVKNFQEAIKKHFYEDLFPFMLLLGMICVLIVLQPDLDTAVIIALTAMTVYFVSGKDALHSLGTIFIVVTVALVGVFAAVAAPYRLSRVQTYLEFWVTGDIAEKRGEGFQVWNCLIAVGSGGAFGLGYGQSRQKFSYLQNASFTDSIYCVTAEEFGLFGSVGVVIAFLYFMSLGVGIAQKTDDKFSALLAIGITTWITIQAFLNIGANLALIPFGGIPLPFISYGGSSTLVVMAGVGLLLNVANSKKSR
jgi:cell division protein FtsW